MNRPEQDLHKSVIQFCRTKESQCEALKTLIHIPNGGHRSRIEAAIFKSLGVRSGVSDLLLPVRCPRIGRKFIGLWIELKAPGEQATDNQREWLALMGKHNHMGRVCDNLLHALLVIAWYLNVDWRHELQQLRMPGSQLFCERTEKWDIRLMEVWVVGKKRHSREVFFGTEEMFHWATKYLEIES